MNRALNAPPAWPEPPAESWEPPEGWRPDPAWGPVPAGWRLWADRTGHLASLDPGTRPAPMAPSEDLPASGARIPEAPTLDYPVSVTLPGELTEHEQQVDDHGFGPAKQRRDRPRLRLAVTITVAVLGLLIAGATAWMFVRVVDFAHTDLPAEALSASSSVIAPAPLIGPAAAEQVLG